jgi:PAS domain S-box-containing protein
MGLMLPRLKHRDLALLAVVSGTVLVLSWIVARDLHRSADAASRLYQQLSRGLNFIDQLQFDAQEVRRILLYALHTTDADLQLRYVEKSREADAKVHRLITSSIVTSFARADVASVEQTWRRYLGVRDEVIGLILEGSLPEAVALDEAEGALRFNDVRQAIAALKRSFEADASLQATAAKTRADLATQRLALLVMIVLAGSAAMIHIVNRRAVLENLLQIQAQKGSILQAVPDPVISVDAMGRIMEWNAAAEREFGWSRAEAIGRLLDETVVPPSGRRVLSAERTRMLSASLDTRQRVEATGLRRDGSMFPIEIAAVAHIAPRERMWTLHIADVTRSHLIEEQLRRARDAAEAADRAKGDFLATMSHELRTPLVGVVGIADLLQGSDLPARSRDLVRMLRSSANALLALVSDILDYSRIEAGLLDLSPGPFSLRTCIEDAIDMVTEQAARKGLELGYVIDEGVIPGLMADQSRVRQVLLNLLANAVKFTDEGEVSVRATASANAGDGVTVSIRVQDTGCGIPEHLQDQLFKRFSQLSPASGMRTGTGLGLAISERLSRLLGGSLTVESAEGRGSSFTFTFAAAVASIPDDPLPGALSGRRAATVCREGIVGDQVRALFRSWGIDSRALDLAAGSSRLEPDEVDVVVIDEEASGNWRDLVEPWSRAVHRIPIVRLARLSSTSTERTGDTYVLRKPVRARALHDAIVAATTGFSPAATALAPSYQPLAGHSLAILLVEDNDANRRVVQLMINELGLEADEAADGLTAVERAAGRRYDVILMDVQMPGLDGLAATRRIRSEQTGVPPIIIGLTANVLQEDEARCREAGMDGYLPKPLRLAALADVLTPIASRRAGIY